jgi:hypothetical protein
VIAIANKLQPRFVMPLLARRWRAALDYLREVSGENDYGRYRQRIGATGGSPLSPSEFYVAQVRRKYSRINRCC